MIEHLEYRFRESGNWRRAGFFEVDAPKLLVDGVTSGYGPMLDETRADAVHRILNKTYDGSGGVTLGFDIDMYARGWKPQPADRALRVLAMLGQIEAAASRQGLNDPRINFTVPFEEFASDNFRVSFTKPQGSGQEAATKIKAGMLRAASLLPFDSINSVNHIDASYDEVSGFSLYTRKDGIVPVLWADSAPISEDGRVELVAGPAPVETRRLAQARLVALIGIVSALDPLD